MRNYAIAAFVVLGALFGSLLATGTPTTSHGAEMLQPWSKQVSPVIKGGTGVYTFTFPPITQGYAATVSVSVPGAASDDVWTVSAGGATGTVSGSDPYGPLYIGPGTDLVITGTPSDAPGIASAIGTIGLTGEITPASPTAGTFSISPVTITGTTDVSITNASIPVTGTVDANITNASVAITGNVGITSGTVDAVCTGAVDINAGTVAIEENSTTGTFHQTCINDGAACYWTFEELGLEGGNYWLNWGLVSTLTPAYYPGATSAPGGEISTPFPLGSPISPDGWATSALVFPATGIWSGTPIDTPVPFAGTAWTFETNIWVENYSTIWTVSNVGLLDSSGNNQTLTGTQPYGSVPSPAGTAFNQAAEFLGTSAKLVGPHGPGGAEGAITPNWTLDLSYTPSAADVSGQQVIISRPNEWLLQTGSGDILFYYYNSSGVGVGVQLVTGIVAGTTYQVEVGYSGSEWYYFVNGTLVHSATATSLAAPTNQGLVIGGGTTGIVDEVRASNSLRNSTTFTAYVAPFTADANTSCLYHLDQTPAVQLYWENNNALLLSVNGAGSPTSQVFTQQAWHHIVATYGAGTIDLYVDGASVQSYNVASSVDAGAPIYWGTGVASFRLGPTALYPAAIGSAAVARHYASLSHGVADNTPKDYQPWGQTLHAHTALTTVQAPLWGTPATGTGVLAYGATFVTLSFANSTASAVTVTYETPIGTESAVYVVAANSTLVLPEELLLAPPSAAASAGSAVTANASYRWAFVL